MAINDDMDGVTAHSPASSYATSKLDCEYLARMFYTNHGLCTTCLRYFNVYGPRQDPNSAYAAEDCETMIAGCLRGLWSVPGR